VNSDPKSLVANGYDQMAGEYLARFGVSAVRERWFTALTSRLTARGGARVLDLGCGAGLPVARDLIALGHDVLGIDGSEQQVALARRNVPSGEFRQGDMTTIELPKAGFDAVCAFYSITHVPRSEHRHLMRHILGWLKPGGVFVASLGATATPEWQGEWLGAEMYFSHFGADENTALVRDAGFIIEQAEEQVQDNEDQRFLWIVARKPAPLEGVTGFR
jgi:SAM-dependent methyltransferase